MSDKEQPPSGRPPTDQARELLSSLASSVSEQSKTGEGRVALAGMAVIAVWVVFDVIIQSYGFDNMLAVLGVIAVVVPRLDEATYRPVPRKLVMKTVGYLIVVFGVIELIFDLRNSILEDSGAAAGAMFGYVAFGLAFWGARAIKLGES